MLPSSVILWLVLKAAALLLAFFGLGMYLRGFWVYFRTLRWLWYPGQEFLRRRYRCSVLAVLLREPELIAAKNQVLLAVAGLPLFAVGGFAFNALAKPF